MDVLLYPLMHCLCLPHYPQLNLASSHFRKKFYCIASKNKTVFCKGTYIGPKIGIVTIDIILFLKAVEAIFTSE